MQVENLLRLGTHSLKSLQEDLCSDLLCPYEISIDLSQFDFKLLLRIRDLVRSPIEEEVSASIWDQYNPES